jgi:hypothetical protein
VACAFQDALAQQGEFLVGGKDQNFHRDFRARAEMVLAEDTKGWQAGAGEIVEVKGSERLSQGVLTRRSGLPRRCRKALIVVYFLLEC